MDLKYLVYLHSLWFSQEKLSYIFNDNTDYKSFYDNIKSLNFEKYKIRKDIQKKILDNYEKIDLKKIDKTLEDLDVKIITINNDLYPKNLKQIAKPPYFLYLRWEINPKDNFLSVIWSRKSSIYAKNACNHILKWLLNHFTIVSGWAIWSDSIAHKTTLDNKWKTIAVFWTWIDINYPSSNSKLYDDIIKNNWGLISIFPLWTPWSVFSFPIRNEIVAWISSWVLVLQAWEKSWTLITANLALEQWKDVFCIPSHIFDTSYEGSNNLIKNWNAKLVTSSQDILEEYNYKEISQDVAIDFQNDIEEELFLILKNSLWLSVDELLEKTDISYTDLSINLSMLEIRWIIKKDSFWKYFII